MDETRLMEDELSTSERTCIGCREKASPEELERFVVLGAGTQSALVFDARQRARGRGAHVHARPACVEQAVRRGGFARSFRQKLRVDEPQEMLVTMREGIGRRLTETLQAALVSGNLVLGGTQLEEAVRHGRVALILLASNAGDATAQKLESNAARKTVTVRREFSGEALGSVARRDFVAVIGVTSAAFASRIDRDLVKLVSLGAFPG